MAYFSENVVANALTARDPVEATHYGQNPEQTSAPAAKATNMSVSLGKVTGRASNTTSNIPRPVKYTSAFKRCSETARFRRMMRSKYPAAGVDLGRWVVEKGVWVWTNGEVREQEGGEAEEANGREDSFVTAYEVPIKDETSPCSSPLAVLDLETLQANQMIDELDQAFTPTWAKWN